MSQKGQATDKGQSADLGQQAEETRRAQAELLNYANALIRDMDSRIIFWSRGAEELYGWTKDEAIGQVSHTLFRAQFPESLEDYQAQLFGQGHWEGEIVHTRRDGSRLVVASHQVLHRDVHGNPVRILEIDDDVTERKRVESQRDATLETLRESEEKYRTVADFTYDWEYWLGPDGNYIYVSPSCERITGYRPDEFIRDPELLEKIAHPADRAMIAHYGREALESREAYSLDFRIITRGGEERWIGHWSQPVYSADGKWLGRRGSNRDITDRKRAEEALRASEERFRSFAENAAALVCEMDLEGQYLYANPAFTSYLGYQPEEVIGRKASSLVHPDELAEAAEKFGVLIETDTPSSDIWRFKHKNGEWKWFHCCGNTFRAADGQKHASPRDGNSNAIFVRTNNNTGTNTDRSFCLLVY